jgi:triphosphoribosyl-dephospho-CoA synthase
MSPPLDPPPEPPPQDPLATKRAARAMWSACVADVRVMKPGHIQVRPASACVITDAVQSSAQVAPQALCAPASGVGRRIYAAVEATHRVVPSCDTNLGILVLCAPLVHAFLVETRGHTLRARLHHVLANLTSEDADLTRRAVRLAIPEAEASGDWLLLHGPPNETLREAMARQAGRDRIAAQYLSDYQDVLVFALHRLRQAKARWKATEWALASVYLGILARFPDTWLEHRFGTQTARAVSASAAALEAQTWASPTPQRYADRVRDFDARLRGDGFTPRTTADLSVATLLAARLQQWVGPVPRAADPRERKPSDRPRGNAPVPIR